MSKVDLDALEALEAKAIEAPWGFPRYCNCLENTDNLLRVGVFAGLQGSRLSPEGELIVAMRNAFPAMIAELRQLRKVAEDFDQIKEMVTPEWLKWFKVMAESPADRKSVV